MLFNFSFSRSENNVDDDDCETVDSGDDESDDDGGDDVNGENEDDETESVEIDDESGKSDSETEENEEEIESQEFEKLNNIDKISNLKIFFYFSYARNLDKKILKRIHRFKNSKTYK